MTINKSKKIIIVGAGGHARAITSLIKLSGNEVNYYLDDDTALHGKTINGYPVRGDSSQIDKDSPVFLAIGSNQIRKEKAEAFPKLHYPAFVHPSAIISPEVEIGAGSVIMAGAIIQAGSKIGDHVIVNSGVVIEHDCVLENFSHIAPNASLAGSCTLKEGAFFGINACAIEGKTIGAWSVIGAGATVISDIPEQSTAVGVPAKIVK